MSVAVVLLLLAGTAYALWRMPDAMPPTVAFGVRVPPERQHDPAVRAALRSYRAALAVITAVMAATAGGLAAGHVLRRPLATVAVTVGFVLLAYLDYYAAHRRLLSAKAAGGWYAGRREGAAAETSLRVEPPSPIPWSWLLPAVVVTVATAAVGASRYAALPATIALHFGAGGQPDRWGPKGPWTVFLPVATQVLLTALLAGLGVMVGHTRHDLDPADPEGSAHRHAAFRRIVLRLLLVLAAAVDLTLAVTGLAAWKVLPEASVWLALLPTLAGAVYVVAVTLRVGQEGARLSPTPAQTATGVIHRDDDRHWVGGALYVNHGDPAIVVAKRFGVGWTLNFGHPATWVIILALISLPWLLQHL